MVGLLKAVELLKFGIVFLLCKFGDVQSVLIIVHNLHGPEVNCHYSVLWMFIGVGGEGRSDEEVIGYFGVVFYLGEKAYMVSMAVTVELPSDCVGVAFGQSVEPHRPLV